MSSIWTKETLSGPVQCQSGGPDCSCMQSVMWAA